MKQESNHKDHPIQVPPMQIRAHGTWTCESMRPRVYEPKDFYKGPLLWDKMMDEIQAIHIIMEEIPLLVYKCQSLITYYPHPQIITNLEVLESLHWKAVNKLLNEI